MEMRPDQQEYVVSKVATAMAEAHLGPGIDPAGYMNEARSFTAAALAFEDALHEAKEIPDPTPPVEEEPQPPQGGGVPVKDEGSGERDPNQPSADLPPPNPPAGSQPQNPPSEGQPAVGGAPAKQLEPA